MRGVKPLHTSCQTIDPDYEQHKKEAEEANDTLNARSLAIRAALQKTRYVRRALAADHRHLITRVRMEDRRGGSPRQMADLFQLLADHEINILEIAYRRSTHDLPLGIVEVVMLLETRGPEDADMVLMALADAGFELA